MIPIKVPNLELSSGKLPAAYRIDPVMLGNPWHGLIRLGGYGNDQLETNAGPVVPCDYSSASLWPVQHCYLWRPGHAPGAPAWIATPNPDPSTGYEYTDYLLHPFYVNKGYPSFPQFIYPERADFSGTEGCHGNYIGEGWLAHGSDGLNWFVEAPIVSGFARYDPATDEVAFEIRARPWGVIARNEPAPVVLTGNAPAGQAGSAVRFDAYPGYFDETAVHDLAVVAVSPDGTRVLFGLELNPSGQVKTPMRGYLGLWEVTLNLDGAGSTMTVTLTKDRDGALGSVSKTETLTIYERRTQLNVNEYIDASGNRHVQWTGLSWVDDTSTTPEARYEDRLESYNLNGHVISAYFDQSNTLNLVYVDATYTRSESGTESASAGGEYVEDPSGNCISDDRWASAEISKTGSASVTLTIRDDAGQSVSVSYSHSLSASYRHDWGYSGCGAYYDNKTLDQSGSISMPWGSWNDAITSDPGGATADVKGLGDLVLFGFYESPPSPFAYFRGRLAFVNEANTAYAVVAAINNELWGHIAVRGYLDTATNEEEIVAWGDDPANVHVGPLFSRFGGVGGGSLSWPNYQPNRIATRAPLWLELYNRVGATTNATCWLAFNPATGQIGTGNDFRGVIWL